MNRDPKRIDSFLDSLSRLWKEYPDLRFMQLIDLIKSKEKGLDLFYLEDEDLKFIIEELE